MKHDDDQWPNDLIAFKWADTLSEIEQSELLAGSLGRLQDRVNEAIQQAIKNERAEVESLHLAICQAVHLMNQGDFHAGHDLLRQALVDYADKKAPLSRAEIVREQQRGGDGVAAAMIFRGETDESSWCNPCWSYHSKSQPCFDAATAIRHSATQEGS